MKIVKVYNFNCSSCFNFIFSATRTLLSIFVIIFVLKADSYQFLYTGAF